MKCNRAKGTIAHLLLECGKYEPEPEKFIDVVHEQFVENKWNAWCVEKDSCIRNLVGVVEECSMT
ncbi:hypothetical protein FHG87_022488, partial [Trinorchestia longiramus]